MDNNDNDNHTDYNLYIDQFIHRINQQQQDTIISRDNIPAPILFSLYSNKRIISSTI